MLWHSPSLASSSKALYLADGSTTQVVWQQGQYKLVAPAPTQSVLIDGFVYDTAGNPTFVLGSPEKLTAIPLKGYSDYSAVSPLEQKYLNSLDVTQTFDRELMSRLTLAKVVYLQNGGALADWQYVVGNNIGLGSGDLKLSQVLQKAPNFARWLLQHGRQIQYLNMFDEKEYMGDDFMSIVAKTNTIIEKRATIKQNQATIKQNQEESRKYQAVIDAYKKVLGAVGEGE